MPKLIDHRPRLVSKDLQRKIDRSQIILNLAQTSERADMIMAIRETLRQMKRLAHELYPLASLEDKAREEWLQVQRDMISLRSQYLDVIGIAKRPADLKGRGRGNQAPPVDAQVVSDHPGSDQNGLSNGLDAEPLP